MQFQPPPNSPDPLRFLRGVGYGFLAGLVLGVMIGWFFHGVVSLFVRFGLLLILLVPLALVAMFLWRARRAGGDADGGNRQAGGMRVYTWSSGETPGARTDDRPPGAKSFRRVEAEPEPKPKDEPSQEEIIDLEFEELKRDVDGREQS